MPIVILKKCLSSIVLYSKQVATLIQSEGQHNEAVCKSKNWKLAASALQGEVQPMGSL